MSTTVDQAWIEDFESFLHHRGQQKSSRLANAVRRRDGVGDKYHWERLNSSDFVPYTGRATPSPINDVEHDRRRSTVQTYEWGELVARSDLARIIIDPENGYMRSASNAYGRRVDVSVLAAIESDTITTTGAGVAIPLPATQLIGNGTGALTLTLIRNAKRLLDEAEVGDGPGERFLAVNAKGFEDLLQITEFVSRDYSEVKALATGMQPSFLGFQIVQTELVPAGTPQGKWQFQGDNVTGVAALAWERSCVGLAISDDKFTQVAPNPERKFGMQIYCEMTLEGARIEDEGVVVIDIAQ